MDNLTVKAPAKINLFLRIIKKREDGYHNIVTIFQKISLWDEITLAISKKERGICLECSDDNLPGMEDNLAFKAAKAFLDYTGIDYGVYIKLKKQIPIGAGLGGGSSDAAAVLKGLNKLSGGLMNSDDLNGIGCRLGADVPFFMHDAASAIGTGVGNRLKAIKIPLFHYLLVWPGFSISTKWVYEHFELTTRPLDTIFDAELALHVRRWTNDLEMAVTPIYPQIKAIKNRLMELGAETALMSGSGSTVFGVFSSAEKAKAAASGLVVRDNQRIYLTKALG
ncbi:MAG: 4-(cytidine 5'-diphospho)-2-C-methyl-D-erythritol kinase [Dissulfurimicrobium sp.]|uniref:4-(cytidine 5'-diphospho)-2-C-methyl-D-erythritol kinase n=1 Tax=Dissulfurimicrobium TaxID=1769732 RepID=UPI001EDA44C6|nr:4-(cytidine 5'-diphospho)-2-C-methyl-D-erythritol kinase [Dissulfurimicrobium hydrothermale]UKL14437.1 4-(cytidine 5'-diphospho)-2-C-methyl-D-erythritol kinase [Dissulfurimicrobium hydrothermale]